MPKQQLPNKSAFEFLNKCPESRYDLTSTAPFPKEIKILITYGQQIRGSSRGSKEALEACKKFFKGYGINCQNDNIALNKDGVLDALLKTYKILNLNDSNGVIVPTPTFGYYFQQLVSEDIKFTSISSKKENDFLPDLEELEEIIIKDKPKALLLCHPNNPTGSIMTKDYAEKLALLTEKHDIFIISDEIFLMSHLSESKTKHHPIAALEGMSDRTLTISSPSKAMGHPQFRMAFCTGPKSIIEEFSVLGGHSPADQEILIQDLKANEENLQYLEESRLKYLENIDILIDGTASLSKKFNKILGKDTEGCVKPYLIPEVGSSLMLDFSGLQGAFYNGKKIETGLDIAEWMLEEAGVGVVPGECFLFDPKEMLVRVALGYEKEIIIDAIDSLHVAAAKIAKPPVQSEEMPGASPQEPKTTFSKLSTPKTLSKL